MPRRQENRSAREGSPLARWMLVAAIGAFFLAFALQQIRSADFWWQLRTGEWVVQHGTVPEQDELSYTVRGHEWIEPRWLFFALSYLGWSLGGAGLLILAQTAILAGAGLLVIWPSRRIAPTVEGALVIGLGIWAASRRFIVRPEIVTFLMVALFVTVLDRYRRGEARRALWGLPLAQVIWSNSHTLFVLGPALAWLFVAGEALGGVVKLPAAPAFAKAGGANAEARAARPGLAMQSLLALLVTGACLIGPYGLKSASFTLLLWREMHAGSLLGRTIDELRSPFTFADWGWRLWAWLLLAAISAASFYLNRRRLDLVRILVWGAFAYLAVQSVRNVALFVVVAIWATLRNLDEATAQPHGVKERAAERQPRALFVPVRRAGAASGILIVALLAGAWWVATDRYYVSEGSDQAFGLGVAPWSYPGEATEFLLRSGAAPQIFNELADGSYLTWKAQGRYPVFIDGRNEVYGEEFLSEYLLTTDGMRDIEALADRWGIKTAILNRDRMPVLVQAFRASPRWVLVHVDSRDIVFVRDLPEHAELIRAHRIDPAAPWTPRNIGQEPAEAPSRLRREMGAVGRPWHSLGMAKSLMLLGSIDGALSYLEKAHRSFPDNRESRLMLAQLYRSREREADAARLLEGIGLTSEEARAQDEMLADLLRMQGRSAAAIAPLERAIGASPEEARLHGKLARSYLESRDLPRAVDAYHAALERFPDRADFWADLGFAYALGNNVGAALDAYGRALALRPDLPQVHYNAGAILARMGRRDEAAAHFRDALRYRPDFPAAAQQLQMLEGQADSAGAEPDATFPPARSP